MIYHDVRIGQPHTEKLHQIMARTAIFVSEHGGQSEIVLRVKQGGNPTFGFLMPDNPLHPYFRFLVDHPQLLKSDGTPGEKTSDGQGSEQVVTGGALSLLGSVYGTGEDDDIAARQEYNEADTSNLNAGDMSGFAHKLVKEESSSSAFLGNKEPVKREATATKEKIFIPKKNHFVNSASINKRGEATMSQRGIADKPSCQPDKTDTKLPILEPPSFLKRTIDKIVEFILRNGKQFEAVLIEQDKTAGRFPFLLPANQYHSYYLQVLHDALESKLHSKNPLDGNKRKAQEAVGSALPADEEIDGGSLDSQRKEKFKMVIGSKKESNDQSLKPVRQSGVTTDEAAAIVLAATRGWSPAFQNTSAADSDTGRASSIGSLSLPQNHKPFSIAPVSNGQAGDVAVATAVAKSVALVAAGEADSSEASLSKEQKLKAERLKRAKMFAAVIKSGGKPMVQLVNSSGTPNGCTEPSTLLSNHEEREGSCVPFDAETSCKERNYRKKHSRSMDNEEDLDDDDKHLRKKHRSSDHKHHKDKESKHHHSSHHKHRSDSEDESRTKRSHRRHHRRHKHHSDSEDEDRHGKSSRHRHRHRTHDSPDEDRDSFQKHRRKHRSPSEKSEEIEEGEFRERSVGQSEEKSGDGSANIKAADAAKGLDAKSSDVTEVPSDLRAKIRAMLLETI